jgi:hypothetical protein
MGNIFEKSKRPDRQILSTEYIRRLIDRHWSSISNLSIVQITTFLQTTYSPNITHEMIEDALRLEPSYDSPNQINRHSLLYA